ncbi:MAG TPA: alpha/beta-hydrolase family protein [Acidimicrobiia bacterium]|nr:alpha/beta-hydrolase family protein [Acidimicrobiia bacterium]
MTRPNFLGLVAGVLFLCASLLPSLLPRHWGYQVIVSGIASAATYGLGTLASHLWRRLPFREPPRRLKRLAWWILLVGGSAWVIVTLVLGIRWQQELYRMMGMTVPSRWGYAAALFLALLLAAILVLIGRGIRFASRRVGVTLARWLPGPAAGLLGGVLVGLLVVGLLDGFVVDRFFDAADETFRVSDRIVADDAVQPTSALRSGSPESLVSWQSLGSKGRTFVAGGPSLNDLTEFGGEIARQPIRVYVGLASHPTLQGRIQLVLDELERTGAFEREILCVATATGTGWVDPQAANALEYIWAGDTAIASLQYSYLPSWISFLVDSGRAREAGAALFNAVYERWASLPENDRPRLLVFGESLGADGSEAAFSGVADIRNRTDGVLWAGPPNFSELWSSFTEEREPGSPQRLPLYEDGETVRFASGPEQIESPMESWSRPRVLYLQYASDPVVWWTPRIILRRPDWLEEPTGGEGLPKVSWFPLVTFLQLTVDLANSIDVPAGHGHNYAGLFANGWAAVASPEDWTADDTDRLRTLLIAQERAASAPK